jgi:hypothetical protein
MTSHSITADELLEKLDLLWLSKSAPSYLIGNIYWIAYLDVTEVRGPGCSFAKKVCAKWIEEEPELTQQLMKEEIRKA